MKKTDILKSSPIFVFLKKKIWSNTLGLKSKKVHGIFEETFILALLPSVAFRLQNRVSDFFNTVLLGRLSSEFFRKWAWFYGYNGRSPNILAKNQNFKKLTHGFVDEGSIITIPLISSCHWKTLVPFCLRKKRPENTFLTLTVNYHNEVYKNKLCHSK